jgi:glycosyltransferase involved in cell wall biosynthesis
MRLKIGFVWMLNMATARLCRGFLSNAESIKRSNCKALRVPASKVEVIYRGRRPDIFEFSDKRFTQQPTKFLVVSRLLARKGYHELIIAFDAFHKLFPQSTLTIAGEGPYRAVIERMIAHYQIQDAVEMLGVANDIPGLMKTHDCLLFPSHYEGFSGTLIEAMLSGLPIIASDIEMNKEAVTHNETARLFEVKNSVSLFDNMVWAMQNRETVIRMAHRARKVAEERFDIDAIARQHESYYQRITAEA